MLFSFVWWSLLIGQDVESYNDASAAVVAKILLLVLDADLARGFNPALAETKTGMRKN
jgi:hypothetical protein